jgi:hypothetical protein
MPPNERTVAEADALFCEWMRRNLDHAAAHFGLALSDEPVFGWRLRTIGAPASGAQGSCWLRVISEFPEWALGDTWTGNADANTLTDIPKPRVLGTLEWDEQNWRRQRAEMMTLLPGQAISPTNQLDVPVDLPEAWWAELRRSIDVLRDTPTRREYTDQARIAERAAAFLDEDLPIQRWETVHGDLHWENLLAPQFGLLDWEMWGRGPAGTDAATLLLYSLLVPWSPSGSITHSKISSTPRTVGRLSSPWPPGCCRASRAATSLSSPSRSIGMSATSAPPSPIGEQLFDATVIRCASTVGNARAGAGRPARGVARRSARGAALRIAHLRYARRLPSSEVRCEAAPHLADRLAFNDIAQGGDHRVAHGQPPREDAGASVAGNLSFCGGRARRQG